MAKCDSFPEDLLIEILSWLPVLSLVRFRCVCKSWYVLFRNPNFISKHLNNSHFRMNNDHHRLIVCRRVNLRDRFMSLSYETLQVVDEDLGFQYYENTPMSCHQMLGAFNGIVCLYDRDRNDVMFWNPAIRQIKVAPKCPFLSRPGLVKHRPEYGFGFDFKTNDFKVVTVTRFASLYRLQSEIRPKDINEIAVYSFSTDSWRLINAVIPDGFTADIYCFPRKTCIKRFYSILMTKIDWERKLVHSVLFTFDMSNEVFILTPFRIQDVSFETLDCRGKALTSLNDYVAYITFEVDISTRPFDVSVLDKYGPDGTWTKLYTIGPLSDIKRPLGFWKNDELFFEKDNSDLLLCDPATNELKYFYFEGEFFQLFEYKESLVWFY